jgi:methionine--tRNA ligase
MTKPTFYITTAIDYASGKPHMGHAYEKIAADIIARWNRNSGKDVFFQTGVDEHGQKIKEKAQEINKTPQEFVKFITPQFQNLYKKLNITNDYFIKTTNEEHKKLVKEILQKIYDKGDIYKSKYEGLYCVGCERYYTETDLIDGKICPDHKKEVEKKSEENYFFKLSKYQKELLNLYETTDLISPKSRRQEIINRVKEGLHDISISRNKKTLDWGIEIPFDEEHVVYVWFDALFNYYTGTIINDKEKSHMVEYNISIEPWNKIFGINSSQSSIKNHLGPLTLQNSLFRPNVVIDNLPSDTYNNQNKEYVLNNKDLYSAYKNLYGYDSTKYGLDLLQFKTINKDGDINPVKKWVIDATYDLIH